MRLTLPQATFLAFAFAAGLSAIGATVAARAVEKRTSFEMQRVMGLEGYDWVQITANGMRVHLAGVAPSESTRYRALTLAGQIIDSDHVIDEMGVTPTQKITAPRFSIEILRKPGDLSAIGLIPSAQDRAQLLRDLGDAAQNLRMTDLLETANYPVPENWYASVELGLKALDMLPRSKVSISDGFVIVEAIVDNDRQRRQVSQRLRSATPNGVTLVLNVSAPRPAITPFVLRAVADEDGLRFDACSAQTSEDRDRILQAARAAGATGSLNCVIGLGAPSTNWGDATTLAIDSLSQIGNGTVTFTNADVSLVGGAGVDAAQFEAISRELARALPAPFTLHAAIQPAKPSSGADTASDLPEFQVIRSPEGHLRVSGPLSDSLSRQAVESYLHSRFGMERVSNRIEDGTDLPDGWTLRVLTGIEALSKLSHGLVTIQPDYVELTGQTGDAEARAQVTQLFGSKLGQGANYSIDINYLESLDPLANLPTPQECVDGINDILAQDKITFAPGSVTVEGTSVRVVNRIAEAMQDCQNFPMEIGGHTDSQGREEMNQQLSQTRAEAVLNALLARRVLTANLTARGYGEAVPIGDNQTEEGREANRRIEFKLLLPNPVETPDDTAAEAATDTDQAEGDAPTAEPATPAEESPAEDASPEDTPEAEEALENNDDAPAADEPAADTEAAPEAEEDTSPTPEADSSDADPAPAEPPVEPGEDPAAETSTEAAEEAPATPADATPDDQPSVPVLDAAESPDAPGADADLTARPSTNDESSDEQN